MLRDEIRLRVPPPFLGVRGEKLEFPDFYARPQAAQMFDEVLD
jgi:hypothetical protein